jgi:hypothetical protein
MNEFLSLSSTYPCDKSKTKCNNEQCNKLQAIETITRIDHDTGEYAQHEQKDFDRSGSDGHADQRNNERRIGADKVRKLQTVVFEDAKSTYFLITGVVKLYASDLSRTSFVKRNDLTVEKNILKK